MKPVEYTMLSAKDHDPTQLESRLRDFLANSLNGISGTIMIVMENTSYNTMLTLLNIPPTHQSTIETTEYCKYKIVEKGDDGYAIRSNNGTSKNFAQTQ